MAQNRLQGKVVVITGSTRGIGRAAAEACAREGARVVVSSRNAASVSQACSALAQEGLTASGIPIDVTKKSDLENLLNHAITTFGNVDIWINNAGISGGYRSLHEMETEEIEEVIDTNLMGTVNSCHLIIPYFIKQGGGILINLSGKGGRGDPSPHLATYAATKIAIASLTKSLAKEYKRYPISIHAVMPGMVATDLYKDVKTGPSSIESVKSVPYVLNAIGVPIDRVGQLFVEIAAQEPGRTTGRIYSAAGGIKLMGGIARLMWYRATGKIKG